MDESTCKIASAIPSFFGKQMRQTLIASLFLLVPALIIVNEGFTFEKLALKSIHLSGDRTSARSKLHEIGFEGEVAYENFRLKQLTYSALFSFPLALISMATGKSLTGTAFLIFVIVIPVIIYFEFALTKKLQSHRLRLESDFPGVIEMMTLALSAGETPLSVLERISTRGSGPLVNEFSKVVTDVREGITFSNSLDSMSRRVQSNTLRRFVDALVIAITRGAPLIEVLHSHAREARDSERNRVLAAAAKSEISMMIPVVFLILPISILFALWPSLSNLNLFNS